MSRAGRCDRRNTRRLREDARPCPRRRQAPACGLALSSSHRLPRCRSARSAQQTRRTNSDLAQALTNPVASLIQAPFQNNFDWGGGPHNNAFRYTLNIQPVIPLSLNSDWNLIVRTIVPFASFDGVFPQTETGLADTLQSFFLSPARPSPSGIVWGAGPVFLYPTATNAFFAGRQWGAGPTGVILRLDGPWTYGVLANHVWSLTDVPSPTAPGAPPSESETEEMIAEGPTTPGRWRINNTFLQPFLTYAFPDPHHGLPEFGDPVQLDDPAMDDPDRRRREPARQGRGTDRSAGGSVPLLGRAADRRPDLGPAFLGDMGSADRTLVPRAGVAERATLTVRG